jgi:broad specificity phosphatase PhoE
MVLYFVRHGQTDSNARMGSGQSCQKLDDEPFNSTGIKESEDLAKTLKDIKFDAIISSPSKRTYQTAEVINKYHKMPIIKDSSLRERVSKTYVDSDTWRDLFDFDKDIPNEDGETLTGFFNRIYKTLDRLKTEYANKTILVVAHGGVQHALYAYANKLPLKGNIRISPMKNCEYRKYEL